MNCNNSCVRAQLVIRGWFLTSESRCMARPYVLRLMETRTAYGDSADEHQGATCSPLAVQPCPVKVRQAEHVSNCRCCMPQRNSFLEKIWLSGCPNHAHLCWPDNTAMQLVATLQHQNQGAGKVSAWRGCGVKGWRLHTFVTAPTVPTSLLGSGTSNSALRQRTMCAFNLSAHIE